MTTGVLSLFISFPSSEGDHVEPYVIKPERWLPYDEPYNTNGIDLEESVIVVEFLEVCDITGARHGQQKPL